MTNKEKLLAAFYTYLDELSFYDEYQIVCDQSNNELTADITFRPPAPIEKITIPISIHKFAQIEPADLGIINHTRSKFIQIPAMLPKTSSAFIPLTLTQNPCLI